jgi:hypothetical protein
MNSIFDCQVQKEDSILEVTQLDPGSVNIQTYQLAIDSEEYVLFLSFFLSFVPSFLLQLLSDSL